MTEPRWLACAECGCYIADTRVHDEFHRQLAGEARPGEPPPPPP